MARKRNALFRDRVREFYKEGRKGKVIGIRGHIILVEAEVPEGNESMNAYQMDEAVNEPGEC